MRICLLSIVYPPTSTEGIARQRAILARVLARLGHDVHIVTCGVTDRSYRSQDVTVHEISFPNALSYSARYPNLDFPLVASQALYEGLARVTAKQPCDIVDVPLWAAQGFVTLTRYDGPTVLWLQTTRAQLIQLAGRLVDAEERGLLALEKLCIERADGLLADSQVALESTIRDYAPRRHGKTGIAYLGLPELAYLPRRSAHGPSVVLLVVGRLEHRKGTQLIFEVLPGLLQKYSQAIVRFVGRDNSDDDGWRRRHGTSYPEYFQARHPDLKDRVIFEGFVDDQRLEECYREADILLAPSLYESFGLVYLEGMRAGLPVVALSTGAANEIFRAGEQHGALLIPDRDPSQLADAIARLIETPELRRTLGERGFHRFRESFTDDVMAAATLDFYRRLVKRRPSERSHADTVFQVMEALDIGDAVSNITRCNAAILAELGQPRAILAKYAHEQVKAETRSLHYALAVPCCSLIFHYWGYSESTWLLSAVRGLKAVHYHNITPPQFFAPDSPMFQRSMLGYKQLEQIADQFDLVVGDSRYNTTEFMRFRSRACPTLPLYPVIEPGEVQAAPYDARLLAQLCQPGVVNFVFVGRIVRNKRQDQVMRLFDYYYREVNRHAHLWLVGNDQGDPEFRLELEQLRSALPSAERIHCTGKVPESQIYAYFRAADVFVCASEHEGFCMPIAQAMVFDTPVLAYAAGAVPETMGGAGLLIHQWDLPRLAELVNLVIRDEDFRQQVVFRQRIALSRFAEREARIRLAAIVNYLRLGEPSPLFEEGVPGLTARLEACHAAPVV